jgi:probable HAF family extracellular repeat protein
MSDLGSLGDTESAAAGINSTGQVVGYAVTSNNATNHAFLYSSAGMKDLGTLGGSDSLATDINDSGQIAGYSATSRTGNHAFLYTNGSMGDLGTSGGTNSVAAAINHPKRRILLDNSRDGVIGALI